MLLQPYIGAVHGTFVNLIIKRQTEIRAVKRIFQRRMNKGGKFLTVVLCRWESITS